MQAKAGRILALAADGETPVEFGLRILRDEKATLDQRLQVARFCAPFLHPRPPPPAPGVAFELPESDTPEGIAKAAAAILRAIADGRISALDGRHLVDILDFHRRSIRSIEIERRIEALHAHHRARQGEPDAVTRQ